MSENTKYKIWLAGIAVFALAMFQIMPWLMRELNFDSVWVMFLLVLAVLIVPQANAQKNLRVLENLQYSDEVDYDIPSKIIDYIPFASDWELTRLYNDGSPFNMIATWILRISSILLPLSLLYVNLLIVWVDLGYNATLFIMNLVTYSAYAYFITKICIIVHLLYSINANIWYGLILGLTVFLGFMYLGYMVKVYLSSQGDNVYDKRLGEDFD